MPVDPRAASRPRRPRRGTRAAAGSRTHLDDARRDRRDRPVTRERTVPWWAAAADACPRRDRPRRLRGGPQRGLARHGAARRPLALRAPWAARPPAAVARPGRAGRPTATGSVTSCCGRSTHATSTRASGTDREGLRTSARPRALGASDPWERARAAAWRASSWCSTSWRPTAGREPDRMWLASHWASAHDGVRAGATARTALP
jgi:hypothetical protein